MVDAFVIIMIVIFENLEMSVAKQGCRNHGELITFIVYDCPSFRMNMNRKVGR